MHAYRYVKGDRPTKSYRILQTVGPGYAPGTSPRRSGRMTPSSSAGMLAPLNASASKSSLHTEALDDDVGGSGEEKFESGMRNNANEREAADADNDGRLDFDEYAELLIRAYMHALIRAYMLACMQCMHAAHACSSSIVYVCSMHAPHA